MILIASALFPPEPVVSANISFDLARNLAGTHEVVVISPKPTRPHGARFKNSLHFANFKHFVLDSYTHPSSGVLGRLWESGSFGLHIARFVESNHQRIEVVYANVWPLFSQYALAKVCKKYGIPYVLHVQDVYPESLTNKIPFLGRLLRSLLLPIDRYALTNAASVIAISDQMRDGLIASRRLFENKVHVVRNWQNDSLFHELDGCHASAEINRDNFTFLYLGSISPAAGVDLLIHAFSKANLNKAQLIIAGSGSDKNRCIKIAASCNANIKFMDAMPDRVPEIQARADVLLLPLKKGIAATALPSKMTAYMLSGKPLIASVDQPSEIAKIILDNNCGWVTSPEDIKELSLVMSEVIFLPKDQLSILGENSSKFAKNNLSRKANLTRLAQLIAASRRVL